MSKWIVYKKNLFFILQLKIKLTESGCVFIIPNGVNIKAGY